MRVTEIGVRPRAVDEAPDTAPIELPRLPTCAPSSIGSLAPAPSGEEDIGRFETEEFDLGALGAAVAIFRLVTAQFSALKNAPSKRFRLRLTLGCGEGDLEGANARCRIHLRQRLVDIKTDGCRTDMSTAYSFELPDDVIADDIQSSATDKSGRSREFGGDIGASAKTKSLERARPI